MRLFSCFKKPKPANENDEKISELRAQIRKLSAERIRIFAEFAPHIQGAGAMAGAFVFNYSYPNNASCSERQNRIDEQISAAENQLRLLTRGN